MIVNKSPQTFAMGTRAVTYTFPWAPRCRYEPMPLGYAPGKWGFEGFWCVEHFKCPWVPNTFSADRVQPPDFGRTDEGGGS